MACTGAGNARAQRSTSQAKAEREAFVFGRLFGDLFREEDGVKEVNLEIAD
jgi:hypothetical protein